MIPASLPEEPFHETPVTRAELCLTRGCAYRDAAGLIQGRNATVEMTLLIQATKMLVRAEEILGRADERMRDYLRQNKELQLCLEQAPERMPSPEQRLLARETVNRLVYQVRDHILEAEREGGA